MFDVGDYVVFGTDGVCRVESVGPLDMEGVPKEKIYYTLSQHDKVGNAQIFAPVGGTRVVMRKVLTDTEAQELISEIKDIEAISVEDERRREETYKKVLQSCDCRQIVGLIKQIHSRRAERAAAGKKLPSVDERYFSLAENTLYSELCLPLQMSKDEVRNYICKITCEE